MRLYHGTHIHSADALDAGQRLDPSQAAALHIDGEAGFYLADHEGDAEFFAVRRSTGRVVPFELSSYAVDVLLARGGVLRTIPGRPPPFFEGNELFIPVALFPVFNELLESGDIYAVRTKRD